MTRHATRRCIGIFLVVWCWYGAASGEDIAQPVLPADTLPAEINLDAARLGFNLKLEVPATNPLTKQRVALGRRLFFDPGLSKDQSVSCASCHQPEHGFASPDPQAIGIRGQTGRRNSPTLLNRGFGKLQFWDGRAASLEQQALQPIGNALEMGHSIDGVIARLKTDSSYVEQFRIAFAGSKQQAVEAAEFITPENLASSLASFQRTLLIGDSPVDRFQTGDYEALSDDERQGLWIFESRGHCWKCHRGDNYTDESFHNVGIGFDRPDRDLGRFEVTKRIEDQGKFKTPTLHRPGPNGTLHARR